MSNVINKEDIGRNCLVDGKATNYNKDKEPSPPSKFFKMAGHHWLAKVDTDKRIGVSGLYVYQWSPVNQRWYETNAVGTCDKPVMNLEGAVLVKSIEQPECPMSLIVV